MIISTIITVTLFSANFLEEIPSGSAVLEGVERHLSVLRVTLNRCRLDEGTVGYGGLLIAFTIRVR